MKRIDATDFFDVKANGLSRMWHGRVWLNHPFHGGWKACTKDCRRKSCQKRGHIYHDIPSNADWINKLVGEFKSKRVIEACCITFAATSEKWFQPLLERPQCFLFPRTNYLLPNGKTLEGITKGSAVTYLGPNVNRFAQKFSTLGVVKIPYQFQ